MSDRIKDLLLKMERQEEFERDYQKVGKKTGKTGSNGGYGLPLGVQLIKDDN